MSQLLPSLSRNYAFCLVWRRTLADALLKEYVCYVGETRFIPFVAAVVALIGQAAHNIFFSICYHNSRSQPQRIYSTIGRCGFKKKQRSLSVSVENTAKQMGTVINQLELPSAPVFIYKGYDLNYYNVIHGLQQVLFCRVLCFFAVSVKYGGTKYRSKKRK
jgi:hypothetical protein